MDYFEPLGLKRRRQRFVPDASRVITRFFGPGGRHRQKRIIQRVVSLPDEKSREILQAVLRDFSDRHQDLENPSKIIGKLKEPLIMPNAYEREGYVPNVVYSCGALIHNDSVVIPYAVSDTTSGIATIELKALLDRLLQP